VSPGVPYGEALWLCSPTRVPSPGPRSPTLVWLHCTRETRVVHDQFYSSCKRRTASGAAASDCVFRLVGTANQIPRRRGQFKSGGHWRSVERRFSAGMLRLPSAASCGRFSRSQALLGNASAFGGLCFGSPPPCRPRNSDIRLRKTGIGCVSWKPSSREAELRETAFPSRAWERDPGVFG
jgi:hypothetical protein